LSLSETAVAICVIHAGYKSAFFLNLGKIISKSSTYSDVLGTSNSVKSLIVVVGIFLFGFRSTSYAAQKHAVDGLSVEGIGILCSIFILLGFLGT
jgi:NADH:ubiquinone oxidoreductase subunit 5 (subunit L)/multisubunit Na+/H+ antiporter MnhA subunit